MIKNKVVAVAIVGALAASLGLYACAGGSNSGSSSAAASSAASESASAASTEASASAAASSEAASTDSTVTSDYWAGKLEDGSTVDYCDDIQSMKPGLVILSADGTEGKAWVGDLAIDATGKTLTITDDATQETVTINPAQDPAPGTMQWEIEGYGEVTLEKAADGSAYEEHLAQVGDLAQ